MLQECKECGIVKNINEYYKHPQWRNWVLWRCKECIKSWRKTEREKIMSRTHDRKRYHLNTSWRKDYIYSKSKSFRKKYPEKYEAHKKVWNFLRSNPEYKTDICCVCGKEWKTDLHHEDYLKPNQVYPLCRLCHANRHAGNIELDINKIIILPF